MKFIEKLSNDSKTVEEFRNVYSEFVIDLVDFTDDQILMERLLLIIAVLTI